MSVQQSPNGKFYFYMNMGVLSRATNIQILDGGFTMRLNIGDALEFGTSRIGVKCLNFNCQLPMFENEGGDLQNLAQMLTCRIRDQVMNNNASDNRGPCLAVAVPQYKDESSIFYTNYVAGGEYLIQGSINFINLIFETIDGTALFIGPEAGPIGQLVLEITPY